MEPPVHPAPRKIGQRLLALAREPLVLFSLLAIAVFGLAHVRARPSDDTIIVPRALRGELATKLAAELGRPPTPSERERALEHWKLEQAAAREGFAFGLERDDPRVLSLLRERVAARRAKPVPEPTAAELTAFYEAHRASFAHPELYDFEQVFFDGRTSDAQTRARANLPVLEGGVAAESIGDPSRFGTSLRAVPLARVRATFGPEFAERLASAEPGAWQIARSSEGWHALRLLQKTPARQVALSELRPRLVDEWKREQATRAAHDALQALLDEYQFVADD